MRLQGKMAAVTGAGAGIGRAIAELFAREGAHVYVSDKDGEAAKQVAGGIAAAGFQATPFAADVSREEDLTALFRAIGTTEGRLDILVNNAGLNVRSDFRHLTDADWITIREVNLDGAVRAARGAFPLLKAAGAASLINMSSIMGRRGMRQLAAYAATKGALSALTRALAVEYAPFGIRVNTLAPGFIETALTERALQNPFVRRALLERTPLRRFGTPEDVAKAALFLASEESAYVTGAELVVDGGMSVAA